MQAQPVPETSSKPWPLWQRLLFRFFFIYWILFLLTYPVYGQKPLLRFIGYAQARVVRIIVNSFNNHFLHLGPQHLTTDYPAYRLVQVILHIIIAVSGMLCWSILARRHTSYNRANYWLRTAMRYFIAYMCFLYGIIKIFALQMHHIRLTDMAIPLGDTTPTRLLWHTIGYSPAYQVALGIAEVMAGILLIYRRTIVLGILVSLGVYANVFLMNLAYNIPVKIVTAHLVIMCGYLLMPDGKRLAGFFISSKTVLPHSAYALSAIHKPLANVRRVLKLLFLLNIGYMLFSNFILFTKNNRLAQQDGKPIPYGLYVVNTFIKNGDTLPVLANDSLAWKDFIFERGDRTYASVNSSDSLLAPNYSRGMFYYTADTLKNTLACYKYRNNNNRKDSIALFTLRYSVSARGKLELWTTIRKDSLYFELVKSRYTYKLQQRPFSWLNEYTLDKN